MRFADTQLVRGAGCDLLASLLHSKSRSCSSGVSDAILQSFASMHPAIARIAGRLSEQRASHHPEPPCCRLRLRLIGPKPTHPSEACLLASPWALCSGALRPWQRLCAGTVLPSWKAMPNMTTCMLGRNELTGAASMCMPQSLAGLQAWGVTLPANPQPACTAVLANSHSSEAVF